MKIIKILYEKLIFWYFKSYIEASNSSLNRALGVHSEATIR